MLTEMRGETVWTILKNDMFSRSRKIALHTEITEPITNLLKGFLNATGRGSEGQMKFQNEHTIKPPY